ncbi:MAG: prephenate dehydrogenase [Anaerolineales bacterium]|nr:prephenate dehydrogenase [Anaerolineales bacterium]
MTLQVSIIGLGQIGASIGLALGEKKELLRRVGNDKELGTARLAEKMGAVDRVDINLPNTVREADLVILSLPFDQIRETMQIISQDLKEGCVVMDTGPVKEVVAIWAKELLPEGCHYVGLTPVINAAYLHEMTSGIEAARPDLFKGGLIAIVAPPNTDSAAIKMAADLTRLLGAAPLFADPLEVDGLMASTYLLPQLISAALLNATMDQPGWREGRKIAGRPYAEGTAPIGLLRDVQSLSAMALLNRENALRMLDSAIAALYAIRGDIERNDHEALDERLSRARSGREKWWKGRLNGEYVNDGAPHLDIPEEPGMFSRLFGIGKRTKSKPNP